MAKRNASSFRPGVLQLECRDVPTVIGTPTLVNGVVTVHCDDNSSTVLVSQSAGGIQVQDVAANRTWSFSLASVKRVDVFGGAGNDTFTSRGNVGLRLRLYGGDGDNTFYGGFTRTVMVGGSGDDHMYGRSGNDYIDGGAGDDYIHVTRGKNVLIGGDGDNTIIGGTGSDAITASTGNNIIVDLSSVTSKIDPGTGANVLWLGKQGNTTSEIIGLNNSDVVHKVSAFANGASLTLNDGPIDEPATLNGQTYESFANHPLFSSSGPTIDDVIQQFDATTSMPILDDSWLLAALAGIANSDPAALTQNMVDFGDGTFGVHLGNFDFRVDNQLPVSPLPGNLTPAYAALGDENSLWVPILEKVFADYQGGGNNYAALNGTGGANPAGTPVDVFNAFGYSPQSFSLSQFANTTQLSNVIKSVVNGGFPAVIEVAKLPVAPAPIPTLIVNQDYTLVSYNTNTQGAVTSVVLRNPMGIDGGGSMDSDPLDGLLTVDINALIATTGTIQFGTF